MSQTELGLAYVGLSPQDVLRLKGILVKVITDRLVAGLWRITDPAKAHLIIAGGPSSAGRHGQQLTQHRQTVVAVLMGESDAAVEGCLKLAWPIRLDDVVALLEMIERRVPSNGAMPPAMREHSLIRLAGVLRHSDAPNDFAWRIDGLTKGPTYVAPARKLCFSGDSLMSIGRFDMAREVEFDPISLDALPESSERRKPIVMLQWWVGLLTGPLGLLPWLNPAGTLRLRRFPEFQILHHLPAHRRLAAALSRPISGVDAAADLTQLQSVSVTGFVNAAELCGYLSSMDMPESNRPSERRAPDSRQSLVQIFRKALGIEV